MRGLRCTGRLAPAALLVCLLSQPAAPVGGVSRIDFSIDDIGGPGFALRGLTASIALGAQAAVRVSAASVEAAGREWKSVTLDCRRAARVEGRFDCAEGTLVWAGGSYPVAFSLDPAHGHVSAELGFADGTVGLDMRSADGRWQVGVNARELAAVALAPLLPAGLPRVSGGSAAAEIAAEGSGGAISVTGQLKLAGLAFSDDAGLRAGEGLGGDLSVSARSDGQGWQGDVDLAWRDGEVYWQPLYLRAGHRLRAAGRLREGRLEIASGTLDMAGIGQASFSGQAPLAAPARADGKLEAAGLDARGLYSSFVQPLFVGGALGNLDVDGRIGIAVEAAGGELRAARLDLDAVNAADRDGRFALDALTGHLPWSAQGAGEARIGVAGGRVLSLPFGAFAVQPRIEGHRVQVPELRIPLLGGELSLVDMEAAREPDGWRWQVSGGLTPVPLENLSGAFGWPRFAGLLAAGIPQVRYEKGRLTLEGGLLVQAFDGSVVIEKLVIADPLGPAPRLTADADMRHLDLELLTRAFSFGRITGRVDVSVKGLALSQWKPVAFDARVASSPGDYKRRISQRAVENISALGGAGAAAALQRTFLRFFDDFGYKRIGMSCVLRNGVCDMGGVADAPQGYVIVEGGGIPAITVLGYNRRVDWPELVDRLARITRSGPVVK